jgi:hypothetical protein
MKLFTKNSSWQAKQSIPDNIVTFYGDCVKVCEDFALNFGEQKNWLLHHDNPLSHTSFFPPKNFLTKNKMTVPLPTHPARLT